MREQKTKIKTKKSDHKSAVFANTKKKYARNEKEKNHSKYGKLFLTFFVLFDMFLIWIILVNNPYTARFTQEMTNKFFSGGLDKENGAIGVNNGSIDTFVIKDRKLYKNEKYGYQFSYLAEWVPQENSQENVAVFKNSDLKGPPYFSVTVKTKDSIETLPKFVTRDTKNYSDYIKTTNIYFFGFNAIKATVDKSKNKDKTDTNYSERIYFNKDNTVYIIEMAESDKAKYEKDNVDIENNFSSFRFN